MIWVVRGLVWSPDAHRRELPFATGCASILSCPRNIRASTLTLQSRLICQTRFKSPAQAGSHRLSGGGRNDEKEFPALPASGNSFGIGAFKQHCTFGFWKRELVLGKYLGARREDSMGQFGRITALVICPRKRFCWATSGKPPPSTKSRGEVAGPQAENEKAAGRPGGFDGGFEEEQNRAGHVREFQPQPKREYVEWITGRRAETRNSRLATAIARLTEGKSRHWKYANC